MTNRTARGQDNGESRHGKGGPQVPFFTMERRGLGGKFVDYVKSLVQKEEKKKQGKVKISHHVTGRKGSPGKYFVFRVLRKKESKKARKWKVQKEGNRLPKKGRGNRTELTINAKLGRKRGSAREKN